MAGKHNSRYSVTLAVVLLVFSSVPTVATAEWLGATRAQMGTEVRVYLWHENKEHASLAAEAVFTEIARIEALMSTYKEDSEISAVNRDAAMSGVPVGDELYELVVRSLDISVLTRGAFDITYDSVGQHYDFRAGEHPDEDTLRASLPKIDYRLVKPRASDRSIRFLAAGVRINLGGIAKGYAVERGVAILRQLGISNAIVTAGGDSRLLGDRRGQPWVVGIQNPRADDEVTLRIPLVDEAVSTSGDYERYFMEDGKRYHHIISPVTGEPANGVQSATIVGPDAVMTDALSTSVFVMGVDSGLRLIATLPDYEGIVIDADGRMFYSDGLRPPAAE
ncbi:hypothetical protein BA177_11940 [Woeseia oceani]|uniref:FAD:protein FMN transferase n=1 Tax=Woeseia oceani TaxID=1548547 RepID=A0A193LL66_9GAMM|nr:hypothetical protein BA177_11940 [Woeseia oceani]